MATVTSLTKERILQIEAKAIESINLEAGGNLVLTRNDGTALSVDVLPPGGVTTENLADGSVTDAKLGPNRLAMTNDERNKLSGIPADAQSEAEVTSALASKADLSLIQPTIYPTSATVWPTRASSIPVGYTGPVHFNARLLGAVSVVAPSDMVDNDELTRWFDE